MGTILGIIGTMFVGGAVGTAALVGVVTMNTSAPDKSPNSVSSTVVDYGSNN